MVTEADTEWLAGWECPQQGDTGQRGDGCGRRGDSAQQVVVPVPSPNWLGGKASKDCAKPAPLPSKLSKENVYPSMHLSGVYFAVKKVLGKWR